VKTITGLQPGTSYQFKVRGYADDDGETVYGAFSEPYTVETAQPIPVVMLSTSKVTKTTTTLQWTAIPEADGYLIYGSRCGTDVKRLKTIQNGDATMWTKQNLDTGRYYKYYVAAYRLVNGKKVIQTTSPMIHVATTGSSYTNPKGITVSASSITMKKGTTQALKAAVQLPMGKKVNPHCGEIRYKSSDKTIAKITANGEIKGVNPGKCTIYVYTQNGLYKTVTVTVL
ncbi:MAG: Ig-like domain-containing protein, partial [Oscillospiraceae bacterium]|nr:Ig-like domain-containing protein [Oscillospiraceae bacterium]